MGNKGMASAGNIMGGLAPLMSFIPGIGPLAALGTGLAAYGLEAGSGHPGNVMPLLGGAVGGMGAFSPGGIFGGAAAPGAGVPVGGMSDAVSGAPMTALPPAGITPAPVGASAPAGGLSGMLGQLSQMGGMIGGLKGLLPQQQGVQQAAPAPMPNLGPAPQSPGGLNLPGMIPPTRPTPFATAFGGDPLNGFGRLLGVRYG